MAYVAPADQRVLAGSAATLTMSLFDQNGAPDSGSHTVTVGVTRGDGSVLVAAGTATTAVGATRTVGLSRAQTAATDRLTATWSIGADVVASTVVDVVGGHWFTLAELGRRPGLQGISNPALVEVRDAWADLADRVTGVAWVPRWWSETFPGLRDRRIVAEWPEVRELVSVTVGGVARDDITGCRLDQGPGIIVLDFGASEDVTITYRHGHDRPPGPLVQAGLEWCEWVLTKDTSGVSPRALGFSNEFGSFRYASASGDRPTGLPDVDAMLATYSRRIPGIA
jgi:hypothetical protein